MKESLYLAKVVDTEMDLKDRRIFKMNLLSYFLLALLISCSSGLQRTDSADENHQAPNLPKKYVFNSDWFSQRITEFSKYLHEYKGASNVSYLEIGVYEGRSFLWVMDNILTHPYSKATAIDIFTGDFEKTFRSNLEISGASSKVNVLKGDSFYLLQNMSSKFDIIYIDGDHTAKAALFDAELSWPLLKEGGLMIFDDYLYQSHLPLYSKPQIGVDLFIQTHSNEIEILHMDYQVFLTKTKPKCRKEMPGSTLLVLGNYCSYWYDRESGKAVQLYTIQGRSIALSDLMRKNLTRLLSGYTPSNILNPEFKKDEIELLKFLSNQ